jgi:hypothetical protein
MSRKVITPEATLSYPALFVPKDTPSGEARYSCALIFDRGADLRPLEAAIREAAAERWATRAPAMFKAGQLRWPLRDGAEKESQGYGPGTTFLNCSTNSPPGIVSRYAGADGRPLPITDPGEIYAGCRVRASLIAFAYDRNGNRGCSFLLNNLQKLGDGPRLDGRQAAEDEFEALETGPADFDREAEPESAEDDDDDADDADDAAESVTSRLRSTAAGKMKRRRLPPEPW